MAPCPSKFHICSYGSMPIQIAMLWLWISTHPGSTSRIAGQLLWKSTFASSCCWVRSQPAFIFIVLSHCLSETQACLWCADAHVDAPAIGSVSIQGLYLCLRASFQLHNMFVVDKNRLISMNESCISLSKLQETCCRPLSIQII